MKFLEPVVRLFRPLRAEDNFFGRLFYQSCPNGGSYWEAERFFAPSGTNVQLFIDAPGDRQAPDARQRDFFCWVERNYEDIVPGVEALLQQPAAGELKLGSISIPRMTNAEPKWEMSFEPAGDAIRLYTVEMEGAKAKSFWTEECG